MTAPTLAQILGITRAAISQYENGQTSPGPDVLRRLSLVLGLPTDFFLKKRDGRKHNVFFRSKAATTVAARTRAGVLLEWLADILQALSLRLQFPLLRLPTLDLPQDPQRLGPHLIEDAARETRRHWGLGDGPISNVVWLLENNGIIVTRGEIEEPHMDSFSRYDAEDPVPFIFLNADKSSAVRSRFDAAHELGHCVLHRHIPQEYWSTDAKVRLRELQAHRFAGAFLLPRDTFADDVLIPSLETFMALKRKWLVSASAMLVRCEGIGLVSDEHAVRLWRSLGRRGWKTWEPLDDELPAEMPRLLPKAIEAIAEASADGPQAFLKLTALSAQDAATLTMLPIEQFVELKDSNLVQFRLRSPGS
jgi:Zn-dependent peptidase ImmA (M78 family)/DNA-binding XRE family transcriptional regulator